MNKGIIAYVIAVLCNLQNDDKGATIYLKNRFRTDDKLIRQLEDKVDELIDILETEDEEVITDVSIQELLDLFKNIT